MHFKRLVVMTLIAALISAPLSMSWVGVEPARAAAALFAGPTGLTTGSCDSWANACTLQSALSLAVSGDEIWAQAGTYKPGASGSRSSTFQLKTGVAIYGGFIGNETQAGDAIGSPT